MLSNQRLSEHFSGDESLSYIFADNFVRVSLVGRRRKSDAASHAAHGRAAAQEAS